MSEGDAISGGRLDADEDQVMSSRFSVVETEVYEPRFSADPSTSAPNQFTPDTVDAVPVREPGRGVVPTSSGWPAMPQPRGWRSP